MNVGRQGVRGEHNSSHDSNVSGFVDHMVSVATPSSALRSDKAAVDNMSGQT